MNFSKNLFYTHNNDYMFYSTQINGQTVEVYVTKLYKLVKLIDTSEYILDLEDFISLMISSICKKNICRKFKLNLNLSSNILNNSNLKDNFYNLLSKIDKDTDSFFIPEMNSKWFIMILSS